MRWFVRWLWERPEDGLSKYLGDAGHDLVCEMVCEMEWNGPMWLWERSEDGLCWIVKIFGVMLAMLH